MEVQVRANNRVLSVMKNHLAIISVLIHVNHVKHFIVEQRKVKEKNFRVQITFFMFYSDPRIQIKHSCEVPLPNINKANRKDCRACRKAKCDRVGMTAMPKDRSTRSSTSTSSCAATTTTTTTKTSPMMVTELLDQLAHDLSYDQLMNSSAFDTILRLLEFPSLNPIQLDYHSLYMDAMRTWRNQYNHVSTHLVNIPFTDIFAVLLFLFRTFMIINENDDDKSTENSQFDKLVSILHEEIQRLTGTDQRSACRLKALFMKCYVALAQNVVMT